MELSKVRITIFVALTTFVGYLLKSGSIDATMWATVGGLFLLASGSAALNQYQEHDTDAKMKRTKDRPIPSGKISARHALIFALILIFIGSAILFYYSGYLAMQLGILTLIWYNAFYTPLKKKSAFAVVPGSLIGALPPMVGYAAAGGSITDPAIIAFAFFMFMWQIPHFWLIIIRHGNDYQQGGFPSITAIYSEKQIKGITLVWVTATAVASIFMTVMGVFNELSLKIVLLIIVAVLVYAFSRLFFKHGEGIKVFKYFMGINVYLLAVLILIVVGVYV
jgi:protoheme IX farnesyltransferase